MIDIKVELHGELRDSLGSKVVMNLPEGASVNQLLRKIVGLAGETFKRKIYDSKGRLLPHPLLKIQVNDSDVKFDQKLQKGDVVSIFVFSAIGGG